MATSFKEFSDTYRQFVSRFPRHPLAEEIRSGIGRKRVPSEEWLKVHTKRMKTMLTPTWKQ